MPFVQPSRSDVHVNRPLTQMSHAMYQEQSAFVADQVFPNIPVQKISDRYFVIPHGDANRDDMQERPPSTESHGSTYTVDSTPTYACKTWALHKDVDDQVRANTDQPLDPDRNATRFLVTKALIRREKTWVANYFTTSKWGTDLTGKAAAPGANEFLQWNDANSDPIIDIRKANRLIHQGTGFRANTLVLTRDVWDTLADHPDLVARINAGQTPGGPAIVLRQNLARILELDRVLVMDSIENTAAQGQTAVHAFIASKKALLIYAAPNPGIEVPSGGYTFSWVGYMGATPMGWRISTLRADLIKSDRHEIEMSYDQKLVSTALGVFFTAAIA